MRLPFGSVHSMAVLGLEMAGLMAAGGLVVPRI